MDLAMSRPEMPASKARLAPSLKVTSINDSLLGSLADTNRRKRGWEARYSGGSRARASLLQSRKARVMPRAVSGFWPIRRPFRARRARDRGTLHIEPELRAIAAKLPPDAAPWRVKRQAFRREGDATSDAKCLNAERQSEPAYREPAKCLHARSRRGERVARFGLRVALQIGDCHFFLNGIARNRRRRRRPPRSQMSMHDGPFTWMVQRLGSKPRKL